MPAAKTIEGKPRNVFQAEHQVVARAEAWVDVPANSPSLALAEGKALVAAVDDLRAARKEASEA